MQIAAISDIHTNVYALEAVLADIKKRQVDVIVNLGDILYGPIAPLATYKLLMQHEIVTIRGNQDRQIYEATRQEIDANPTMQFIIEELGNEPLQWMRGLPASYQLTDNVFLCHGTPNNDLVYLLEDVDSGYAKVRTDREIVQLLEGQSSNIIICGHTHTPRAVSLSTGQLIINPGSVGLPVYTDDEPVPHSMETFRPHASYAVINDFEGAWAVEHIKVPYAFQEAAAAAKYRNREDWAHFLTTGRAL
ncbi:metallophosphatase family protein [Veronia nyctiphanis]|uniref:Metallophosphatase family protein n=1 Tax=Veronia nyctiphanis TaxID=1278244 RepID=A0A4Q0YSS9_9GAMM|nr:metallophosphoesterase family protein [Veronia nyctiphanis]RXJ73184.1 metallophosphatase family protein [Veronia nyctiphanis]